MPEANRVIERGNEKAITDADRDALRHSPEADHCDNTGTVTEHGDLWCKTRRRSGSPHVHRACQWAIAALRTESAKQMRTEKKIDPHSMLSLSLVTETDWSDAPLQSRT